MPTINKKFILLIILFIIVFLIAFIVFNENFVSQNCSNIERISITLCNGTRNRNIIIKESDELKRFYEYLNDTKQVNVCRYPSHSESIQFDPKFEIKVVYKNKTTDIYALSEKNNIIKFLNSKGTSGDRGYIVGILLFQKEMTSIAMMRQLNCIRNMETVYSTIFLNSKT